MTWFLVQIEYTFMNIHLFKKQNDLSLPFGKKIKLADGVKIKNLNKKLSFFKCAFGIFYLN